MLYIFIKIFFFDLNDVHYLFLNYVNKVEIIFRMNSNQFYYNQNFFEESSGSDHGYQEKNSLKEVATYGKIG